MVHIQVYCVCGYSVRLTGSSLDDLTFCSPLEAAAKENVPNDREAVNKAMEKAREKAATQG
jgi:hypothetical protein